MELDKLEALISKREAAIEELSCTHTVSRMCFLNQWRFQQRLGLYSSIGLCAGMVEVWWAELCKGNDAIRCLCDATSVLLRRVVLSQLRSVYLRELPATDDDFSLSEIRLLEFKYGAASLSEICLLKQLFGVNSILELDLVLQHGAPIQQQSGFFGFCEEFVGLLTEATRPGLRLLLTRYARKNRDLGETGHRSALVVEKDGACRFYDPALGEIYFACGHHFAGWFAEYWKVFHWEGRVRRAIPDVRPIRVFTFGGEFRPEAKARSLAIRSRIWESGGGEGLNFRIYPEV